MSDSSDSENEIQENKVHIFVDYKDKNKVRKRGAKWDKHAHKWYFLYGDEEELLAQKKKFKKWLVEDERIYIDCEYEDRDSVKELGGRWDTEKKLWYCYPKYKDKMLKTFREVK
jgi:hypothetical protein